MEVTVILRLTQNLCLSMDLFADLDSTFPIVINGDDIDEDDETFFITLEPVNTDDVTINGPELIATATILNDDLPPSLSINPVTQAEGSTGITSFIFQVDLNPKSGKTTSFNYFTQDISALVSDGDYEQILPNIITFNP